MSRVFIELFLDENVDVLVADLLRARGFSVTTVRELDRLGMTDTEQMAYAIGSKYCLVTHDKADFEAIHRQYLARGEKHFGIILAVRRPANELARRLLVILNAVTADEMEDQLRYI